MCCGEVIDAFWCWGELVVFEIEGTLFVGYMQAKCEGQAKAYVVGQRKKKDLEDEMHTLVSQALLNRNRWSQ